MKKFFRFAAIAVAAIALFSCEKPQGDDTQTPGGNEKPEQTVPEYTDDLTFTLEVVEVEADQAKIKVEHNGTTKDTWYGFATTESDVEKAIADVLAEGNVTLKKNTKTNITVRNLEPETEYTFIAVGIKADGTTYGNHAIIEFTTAKAEEPTPPTPPAPEEYTVNPNWTVTYIGEYEQQGQVFEHVVLVESSDTNPFFITAWPVDYFEQLGIEAIVDAEIEGWEELLAANPKVTWEDIVSAESSMAETAIDPEYGTKWYAMAIGCDTNGQPTGLYALSEVIDLETLGGEEEEPTAEYSAWIGDWTFTGANGVAFEITFSKRKVNRSFIMTGWEGITDMPVSVTWVQEDQIWYIGGQILDEGVPFTETVTGDIYFLPYAGDSIYDSIACVGRLTSDGTRVSLAYEAETEDGKTIVMEGMGYWGFGSDKKTYIFSSNMKTGEMPTFPITITPATKATTYAVKEFKGGKKTLNTLAPKTFKAFSLCDMSLRTF